MSSLAAALQLREEYSLPASGREAVEVHEVRWADGLAHTLRPAFFACAKRLRGSWLSEEPAEWLPGACAHGYDAEGRLVSVVECSGMAGCVREVFYLHKPDGVARLLYDFAGRVRLIEATWFAGEPEAFSESVSVHREGRVQQAQYRYAQGRLVEIALTGASVGFRDLEYDGEELARVFWRSSSGVRSLHFERVSPDAFDAPALAEQIAEAVLAELNALEEPYYAVSLWTDPSLDQQRLPPLVSVGTHTYRSSLPEGDDVGLWHPGEWDLELELSVDEALMRRASQAVWQHGIDVQVVFALAVDRLRAQLPPSVRVYAADAAGDVVAAALR